MFSGQIPLAAQTSQAERVQQSVSEIEPRLQSMLEARWQEHGFPGACIAFVLPSGDVGAVAVGHSDAAQDTPLTTSSRMFSGSIGKTYVAAVALQLVDEGALELDGKIAEHLAGEPWFSRLPSGDEITLRMLLNHRSGIPEHVWLPGFHAAIQADPYKVWKPEELVAYILDAEPLFPPDEGWSYADTNYVVVGMILEKVTGKSWFELLQTRLLERLDLQDTIPSDRPDMEGLVNGFTTGTGFHEGPTHENGRYFANPQFEWCGGGVASTTADLARWCKLLFSGDVIPAALRRDHVTGTTESRRIRGRYGLGVIITETRHGTAHGHSGIMPGFLSQMAYYTDLDLAVAIQFNTDRSRQLGRGLGFWLDDAVDAVLDR